MLGESRGEEEWWSDEMKRLRSWRVERSSILQK